MKHLLFLIVFLLGTSSFTHADDQAVQDLIQRINPEHVGKIPLLTIPKTR
jgi:hypothetical protein